MADFSWASDAESSDEDVLITSPKKTPSLSISKFQKELEKPIEKVNNHKNKDKYISKKKDNKTRCT